MCTEPCVICNQNDLSVENFECTVYCSSLWQSAPCFSYRAVWHTRWGYGCVLAACKLCVVDESFTVVGVWWGGCSTAGSLPGMRGEEFEGKENIVSDPPRPGGRALPDRTHVRDLDNEITPPQWRWTLSGIMWDAAFLPVHINALLGCMQMCLKCIKLGKDFMSYVLGTMETRALAVTCSVLFTWFGKRSLA